MPIADIYNLARRVHADEATGEDAAIAAAQRADEMLEQGDIEGQMVWKRIVAAINDLQRALREPGEAVN